jgi:hypothetical protein
MADALIKAWHGVFDRGTKQAQERLKKAHGHKPEFQAFLKSRGIEGGERSAKQATTSLKKATDTKVAAQKIADMRFKKALQASSDRVREMGRRRREGGEGLGGSLETTKDVIAHIKQYGSIKAGRLGEAMDRTQLIGKVAKDIEKKKAATKIVDRLKTISYGRGAGLNPAKDMKLNPSSPLKTDMSALSNKRHSMNYEEVQIDEVSKAEAEKVLGGAVKEKPKMPPGKQPAGYRYVRGLARRAMKGGVSAIHKSMEKTMAKEEVEQVVEQDDSMEKKEMAQTQLHFIKYAAEEILAFIDMGGEVEEWYQNKLSKVQSEVESLHSYIEGEKRRTGMVEEVEQIDEFVDRETRLAARKAETGSSTKVSSGDVLGRRGGHETPKDAIARRVGKDSYGIKSGGKTSIYNRSPKPNLPEEAEQIDEISPGLARKAAAASQVKAIEFSDYSGLSNLHNKEGKKEANRLNRKSDKAMDYIEKRQGQKGVDKVNRMVTRVVGEEAEQVDEKAPPGAKYERMVKHIKKGYAKGGLTPKEKSIAYATAWKAYGKKEEVEVVAEAEGTVAVTPKEKALAAHHGDPKKITYGDVIKARLKSAAAKKMGK